MAWSLPDRRLKELSHRRSKSALRRKGQQNFAGNSPPVHLFQAHILNRPAASSANEFPESANRIARKSCRWERFERPDLTDRIPPEYRRSFPPRATLCWFRSCRSTRLLSHLYRSCRRCPCPRCPHTRATLTSRMQATICICRQDRKRLRFCRRGLSCRSFHPVRCRHRYSPEDRLSGPRRPTRVNHTAIARPRLCRFYRCGLRDRCRDRYCRMHPPCSTIQRLLLCHTPAQMPALKPSPRYPLSRSLARLLSRHLPVWRFPKKLGLPQMQIRPGVRKVRRLTGARWNV